MPFIIQCVLACDGNAFSWEVTCCEIPWCKGFFFFFFFLHLRGQHFTSGYANAARAAELTRLLGVGEAKPRYPFQVQVYRMRVMETQNLRTGTTRFFIPSNLVQFLSEFHVCFYFFSLILFVGSHEHACHTKEEIHTTTYIDTTLKVIRSKLWNKHPLVPASSVHKLMGPLSY